MTAHQTEAPQGFRIWAGIICPEPPSSRYYHDDMLEQAKAMLATRERNFPMMVQRREISGDEAKRLLHLFSLMVADLEWIIATKDGKDAGPIPITEADRAAICSELDNSVGVLGQMFRETRGPVSKKLSDQAHDVIALRWNYDPERGPIGAMGEMHRNAILTGKCRHQARLQQKRSDAS